MAERHWYVVSPEVELYPGSLYGLSPEPPEYGCEVVCVAAATQREAVVAGVKLMSKWPAEARGDDRNPFAGVKAEDAACAHGFCWCELPDCTVGHDDNGHGDYCETCHAEDDAREAEVS